MMRIDKVLTEYWMERFKKSQEELAECRVENEKLQREIKSAQQERDFWHTKSVSE